MSAALRATVVSTMTMALLAPLPAQAAAGQALVIGEATYASLPPLPGCALSAHAMAAALRRLGFAVDEQDDASSGALYAGIGALAQHISAAPGAPAFVYVCGYILGYNDRPFLLPVDAHVGDASDVLAQGVLLKSLRDALVSGKPTIGVLAVDAVPPPKAAASLRLEALEKPALPPMLGYIAVTDDAPGNTPMPLAATMVPMMSTPALQGAALLTDTRQQVSSVKSAVVAALSLPDAGLYLAGAPPAPQPAAAAHKAVSLPDESAMTDAQRRVVQQALAHLGYYDGKIDGRFGPDTAAAIRRWQHEEHQPMTGHLTAEEASKLAASWD